ncbi:hotdog fold thioesterase [Sneathiella sp. P13V-1]|uniref:PaaI family thioesterase n=1 Tax=Sneathiella sp. P13V-1 TaxID=2697366 RepID=UPI00187B8DE6|nr:PaaI family thioesterase [Sneathiella sp. P13V-1]MBE7636707.1 hotdog fold thioesterase [Sneathiella sp. P13V-1]
MKTSPDLSKLTGLEQLNLAFNQGQKRAPIGDTMDFDLVSAEEGKVVFEGVPAAGHLNPIGTVHGGYAATLLDSALGCSVHSVLEAGERYTTIDLNVKYIRAMMPGMGKVICTGHVVHKGRRMATAEARLVDENGKLYAHGSTTCMVMSD